MKKSKTFKPAVGGTGKKFAKKRLYDTATWTEFRNRFLSVNPKCYCCGQRAVVVDHIVGHKGKEELFWNETNYIPLCKSDHDTITGLFDRHNPPKTEEKLVWIANKRIQTGTNTKVKVVSL